MRTFIGALKSYLARMWAWFAFVITFSVIFSLFTGAAAPVVIAGAISDLVFFSVFAMILEFVLRDSVNLTHDWHNGKRYAMYGGKFKRDQHGFVDVVATIPTGGVA